MKKIAAFATVLLLFVSFFAPPVRAGAFLLPSDADFEFSLSLLSQYVECEAPDASYQCRLALAATVVNRARSYYYRSSVPGVLFEAGEYECVESGDIFNAVPDFYSHAAARDALFGLDPTGGALFAFREDEEVGEHQYSVVMCACGFVFAK